MKDKVSITLAPETRAQLDAIRLYYMHCPVDVPLSQMIASAISIAYYKTGSNVPSEDFVI